MGFHIHVDSFNYLSDYLDDIFIKFLFFSVPIHYFQSLLLIATNHLSDVHKVKQQE
jgi:hypothetical protein